MPELKLFSLQHQEHPSSSSTEEQSWKEGRGPRRENSFSGVVGTFPGISGTPLKGSGEEENSLEEEDSDGTEAATAPVGNLRVLKGKL
ncbi:hypothetical protein O181_024188 [Austropuccinia psidii MF-1]|uniref:Uncharacterized protein n=1 Tax=Austropuccinia psidii MF-1 TaxID=1389203 RepID=A0A9Q3CIH1_9BASI|nr:hypothetical protein [Austropuccinia psidii MF-1]